MNALIVEGGGMRGVYTAGVLEAFLQRNFDPFQLYIGVSSGACNLSTFIARQTERNYHSYTGHMSEKGFINWWRFLRGGHWLDLDWLWEMTQQHNAIDFRSAYVRLKELNRDFLMVVSRVEDGLPQYIRPTLDNWLAYMKASCAIPFFYKGFCIVDNQPLVDGGLADPLPVEEAYRRGAKTIVVVRTQDPLYARREGWESRLATHFFRNYDGMRYAFQQQVRVYNEALRFIANPPSGVRVIQIAPEKPLKTGRTTQIRTILDGDYQLGLAHGLQAIDSLRLT